MQRIDPRLESPLWPDPEDTRDDDARMLAYINHAMQQGVFSGPILESLFKLLDRPGKLP